MRLNSILMNVRQLLRTIGLADRTPASVRNASRRQPQTRAALQRLQVRTHDDLSELRAWVSPIADLHEA